MTKDLRGTIFTFCLAFEMFYVTNLGTKEIVFLMKHMLFLKHTLFYTAFHPSLSIQIAIALFRNNGSILSNHNTCRLFSSIQLKVNIKKWLVSKKNLKKYSTIKPFLAEVMMGPKCSIAKGSLSAKP